MSISWDEYFAGLLAQVAVKSKDPNTKIGALIVGPDKEIRSTGYNSFPRGLDDNVRERMERPEKYYWIEHAERNAIYNAARCGTTLKGCTVYVNSVPCIDCARGIVQAGIGEVVVCDSAAADHKERWEHSYTRTEQLLKECGVNVRHIAVDLPIPQGHPPTTKAVEAG